MIDRLAAQGFVLGCLASLEGGQVDQFGQRKFLGVWLYLGTPRALTVELDTDHAASGAPLVVPPAQEPDRRAYNREDCPYCHAVQDPLPKAKRKCQDCGAPIYVRAGPDGIRYLLREADLPAHQARWDALSADRAADDAFRQNQFAAKASREILWSYTEAGVRFVEMGKADADTCPTCRAVAGQRFRTRDAPSILVSGCSNDVCRCDYLPVG